MEESPKTTRGLLILSFESEAVFSGESARKTSATCKVELSKNKEEDPLGGSALEAVVHI